MDTLHFLIKGVVLMLLTPGFFLKLCTHVTTGLLYVKLIS